MTNILQKRLARRDWLLADGATGTMLFSYGLQHGDAPELWNLHENHKIRRHYRSYIEAGSDIILTNSFGANAARLRLHKAEKNVYEINYAASKLLREEIDNGQADIICAGSVGPTGDLFAPVGALCLQEGIEIFAEQINGLRDGGADIIWGETMSCPVEANALLKACQKTGMDCALTMSFDTNGRTMMGIAPDDFVTQCRFIDPAPIACGGNCGAGAADMLAALLQMQKVQTKEQYLIAKANCGIPQYKDGAITYSGTAELMADYACLARDCGARIIGGCCGTTPQHIKKMRQALNSRKKEDAPDHARITTMLGPMTATPQTNQKDGNMRKRRRVRKD